MSRASTGCCNINKFSAEIRPRCAISARSAGDGRNGEGGRKREERERERKEKGGRERERETEALRKSWASIPGQASRGGLKLLTRLSNSVEEEERRWPGRNRVSGDVSLPPLFPSASVSLGNQSYFMTFSFHGRKTSSPSPRRREKP